MPQYDWETSPAVIKAEVQTVQSEFETILGEHFVGLYLHGSLAMGGFNPLRSDIDLVALTDQRSTVEQKRRLIELLLRVSKAPIPIEISVLVRGDIFPFQAPLPYDLHFREEWRERYGQELRDGTWEHWNNAARHDSDLAVYLRVLAQAGVDLYGAPIVEALPTVPEQAFRDALFANFERLREEWMRNPTALVLDSCRDVAYAQDGVLLSKDAGGEWGLAHLLEEYGPLVQQSLALYRGDRLGRPVGRAVLERFVEYVSEHLQGLRDDHQY
jgi:predicted nucleotidyltransferase